MFLIKNCAIEAHSAISATLGCVWTERLCCDNIENSSEHFTDLRGRINVYVSDMIYKYTYSTTHSTRVTFEKYTHRFGPQSTRNINKKL